MLLATKKDWLIKPTNRGTELVLLLVIVQLLKELTDRNKIHVPIFFYRDGGS